MELFFTLSNIASTIFLVVSSFFVYKVWKIIKTPQVLFLFWGFIFLILSSIGLLIVDSTGIIKEIVFYGKFFLAIRMIPYCLIMLGMVFLYSAICEYIDGE